MDKRKSSTYKDHGFGRGKKKKKKILKEGLNSFPQLKPYNFIFFKSIHEGFGIRSPNSQKENPRNEEMWWVE